MSDWIITDSCELLNMDNGSIIWLNFGEQLTQKSLGYVSHVICYDGSQSAKLLFEIAKTLHSKGKILNPSMLHTLQPDDAN